MEEQKMDQYGNNINPNRHVGDDYFRNKIKQGPAIMFDWRFKIVDRLDKGSFGSILEALDLLDDNNKSCICKINKYEKMNNFEGAILKKLN